MKTKQLPTIIHGGPFNEDKTPMASLKSRIDKAIELHKSKLSKPFIFSIGATYIGTTKTNGFEEMTRLCKNSEIDQIKYLKNTLIKNGVKKKDILTNNLGRDTVGEIYYIVETIIKPNNFKKFRVITSEFHMKRCLEIYRKLLGKEYTIIPECAQSKMDTNLKLREEVDKRELKSLEIFRSTFKQVRSGDAAKFEEILYSKHKLYCDLPKEDKVRFYR